MTYVFEIVQVPNTQTSYSGILHTPKGVWKSPNGFSVEINMQVAGVYEVKSEIIDIRGEQRVMLIPVISNRLFYITAEPFLEQEGWMIERSTRYDQGDKRRYHLLQPLSVGPNFLDVVKSFPKRSGIPSTLEATCVKGINTYTYIPESRLTPGGKWKNSQGSLFGDGNPRCDHDMIDDDI